MLAGRVGLSVYCLLVWSAVWLAGHTYTALQRRHEAADASPGTYESGTWMGRWERKEARCVTRQDKTTSPRAVDECRGGQAAKFDDIVEMGQDQSLD